MDRRAALLFCALISAPCSATAAAAQEPRARWILETPQAEVGEPVRATLQAEHGAQQRVVLAEPALDGSWVVLEAQPGWTEPDPADPARARTIWKFEIAS